MCDAPWAAGPKLAVSAPHWTLNVAASLCIQMSPHPLLYLMYPHCIQPYLLWEGESELLPKRWSPWCMCPAILDYAQPSQRICAWQTQSHCRVCGLWVSEEPDRRKKTYGADWLFGSVIPVKSSSLWCLVLFEGPHPAVFRSYY